ncbi:hypothetical protein JXA47_07870 [Candidatus Sumerlaeota bacterium]|nr:hypothetical protein [Candidatus Sumerlaeota bacterium]
MRAGDLTYRAARERLRRLIDYERHPPLGPSTRHFHLRAFRDTLEALGRPQDALRVIHLAGTRGKGTTATLLAEALAHRGLRVGLYRSPHVDDLRERITVDGHWISRRSFARLCAQVFEVMGRGEGGDATFRTYFECLTAIALLHFARRRVDWAVIETGLGGRLDATNVLEPELTILTALGIDHTHVLGNRPEQIAREKAGILKRGVPCIIGPQPPGQPRAVRRVIRERADSLGIALTDVSRRWRWEITEHSLAGLTITLHPLGPSGEGRTSVLRCPSLSVAPALASVQTALDELGLVGSGRNPERFEWPLTGRFEIARRRPPLILDGAHCPLAAAQVSATLERIAQGPLRLCLAMMCEKDHAGFVRALGLGADDAVALPALPYPRAAKPEQLEGVLRAETPATEIRRFPTVASAMRWLQTLHPQGITLATGSFYHLAPARRSMTKGARRG